MLNIKKLSVVFALFPFLGIQAQSLFEGPNAETRYRIAQIDSNTLKLRSKMYPSVYQGDLNIYGYNNGDVPVFTDSAYAYRLSLLETEIPLEYNKHVRSYIDLYAVRKRKLVSKVLATSKYYFPIFEEVFDRENIPLEMKYLAVIESALNQNAVSPVGATGMWQFMAPTGRIYGLRTDNSIDERRDIIRSTEAAVKYFKNSYRIYGDWLLVIASYNCGPGNVNKAIRRSGGKRTFWEIMPYLPKETRGYVPAFIAATYVMNYAAEHNLYPTEEEMYYHMDTVMVDNKVSIEQLALALNVTPSEIKAWNPSLKRGYIPFSNNKVVLSLPYAHVVKVAELNNDTNFRNQSTEALTALNKQIESDRRAVGKINYKVKSGESLSKIAKKHDVSLADLKKWNKGKIRNNKVSKGQKLVIYLG
jgi:membrane-bound lytic murein transglycosylase D